MPFTPNNSEQRSHLTCYRGCWHVISRCLFLPYRHHVGISSDTYSSNRKELYNLPAFFVHAASLRQGSPHCGIFLPAASRRSLGRISVPMCPSALSGRIPVLALVSSYLTNELDGPQTDPSAEPKLLSRRLPNINGDLSGITLYFYRLSRASGYVIHVLLTSPPLSALLPAARLAWLRRAASVRSEPGSNSPSLFFPDCSGPNSVRLSPLALA